MDNYYETKFDIIQSLQEKALLPRGIYRRLLGLRPSVISAMGYQLEIWVSFLQIPQFQNSLVSPISEIPLSPSLGSWRLRQGGDSWTLAFALEVVAFGGVEADKGSLLGGALPFPTLCSKWFVGLEREVAIPRQFEAVAISDADGGLLVAGLRLGGRGCWGLACRGCCGEMVLADAEQQPGVQAPPADLAEMIGVDSLLHDAA
ncbi:hypothetical protein V8G54_032668 [Vigna mungo]|uniref:Uncharacterized protein n=1 Tax=Vigna mungo TaxID=3915 RepID=A0AAQ3RJ06_VIGMU